VVDDVFAGHVLFEKLVYLFAVRELPSRLLQSR